MNIRARFQPPRVNGPHSPRGARHPFSFVHNRQARRRKALGRSPTLSRRLQSFERFLAVVMRVTGLRLNEYAFHFRMGCFDPALDARHGFLCVCRCAGANKVGSKAPILASSSPRSSGPVSPTTRVLSIRISTAPAERPRTALASSSSCSPIAPRPPPCRPTSSACHSRPWPMSSSIPYAALVCATASSPMPPSRPFASSCSSSVRRCAPAYAASTSPSPQDAPTRTNSNSPMSTLSAPSARPEPQAVAKTPGLAHRHADARPDGLA